MSLVGSPALPSRTSGARNGVPLGVSPGGNLRQREVAEAQVGDAAAAGEGEQHAGRDDAPHDDAARMGVLQGAEEVARQHVHGGNRARAALHRIGQALAFDPVADAVGDVAHHARLVHVADRGVIEAAERLGFLDEPAAQTRHRRRC